MSDLLSSLGLEFVDPYNANAGLKQLKPQDEPQIFSVITQIPGMPNTVIKFPQHYFEQLKKRIRCHGGSCCIKAAELKEALSKLPDDDKRKRFDGKRQYRYLFPVVLYQGKSAQAYGGPVEIRYMDISGFTYNEWDSARDAVNADIAPFYERDFILTKKSPQMPSAQMHHLESRAKWLTDPALHEEVMKQISDPTFVENYVKVIPPKMTEEEFLAAWNAATAQATSQQTIAEQVLNNSAQSPIIQPAVAQPQIVVPPITATQSVAPTPVEPQQVSVTPVAQVPLNIGIPITQSTAPQNTNVPFTPQNLINGTYNAGTLTNTVSPADVVNMQPVSLAPASIVEQVTPAAVTPVQTTAIPTEAKAAPATSQSEISLADIGDLDAIINSLPKQ
jgi:hypothetical protein